MKPRYYAIAFLSLIIISITACSKKYKVYETKSYSLNADKLSLLGVNTITIQYNEFDRLATISFNAKSKNVLGYNLDLNGIKFNAAFSPNESLDKIELVGNPLIFFSIKDEEIKYTFNSRDIKKVQTKSIANSTLELNDKEKMLSLVYTSLYQDLTDFKNKGTNSIFKIESVKFKESNNYTALIFIGCYTIGGSETAVRARLIDSECARPGCNIVGSDVSCLWGKHACLGTVSYYCPGAPPKSNTDEPPHFFWD
jgi:hypothetical protein